MNILSKAFIKIKDPVSRFEMFKSLGMYNKMDDEKFLKKMYRIRMNKNLDLENPKTYNEKLQWLKLYDRKDIYTKMVDKYESKKIVSQIIGEEYIIPTLGVWDKFDEIEFEKLPKKFVLKCTHDSGGLVICEDKDKLNYKQARKKIEKSLKRNYYLASREWPYKNVKPRIIAEKYMVDESGYELKDYKFFCFNGNPRLMFIASDRQGGSETKFDFYDMDFNLLPFTNGHPNSGKKLDKPDNLDDMKKIAAKLSKDIPQVRVDLYSINGKIYFGEMTFFHWGGMIPFEPEEWDLKIGQLIDLPIK